MSPFTLFFARLVGLVGAENAAQMVREFAGKTIQFPITDHYGFSSDAPILGQNLKPRHYSPLTEAEAMEISQRLLATVRKCCAPSLTEPLLAAESPVMDANCIAHPSLRIAPRHTPAAVPPGSEQEPHKHLATQPKSLSVPQSFDRS